MLIIFIIFNVTKELKRILKINCQQIDSNIYIGCISGRIRDEIWKRINNEPIIREASMLYAIQNHMVIRSKGSNKVTEFDFIDLVKS